MLRFESSDFVYQSTTVVINETPKAQKREYYKYTFKDQKTKRLYHILDFDGSENEFIPNRRYFVAGWVNSGGFGLFLVLREYGFIDNMGIIMNPYRPEQEGPHKIGMTRMGTVPIQEEPDPP